MGAGREPISSKLELPGLTALNFNIETNDCHVWSLSLDQPLAVLSALEQVLSEEERRRAAAFRLPAPRQQFIVARGALRTLLGRYLDTPPAHCAFNVNDFGKPFLRTPSVDLRFNVAHSGAQALIAVARAVEVGVDIEIHRPLGDSHGLARTILSPADLARWQQLPEAIRMAAFYSIWTRKEAVAKAVGQGLSMEFTAMEVSFEPNQPAELLRIAAPWGEPRDWTLRTLATVAGYSAALAARTSHLRISQRRLGTGRELLNPPD